MSNVELATDSNIEIVSTADIVLSTGGKVEITTEVDNALALTATKKEYKIVGDEVYIAKLYEDAPQWMRDLVQLVVDNTMASESAALLSNLVSQLNQFAASYVPLNTHTQSMLELSEADAVMHGMIETLNSNFNDGLNEANSQIIGLQSTKASKDEVATKVVETLTAQLLTPTSELGATIANLQQAIVTGDSANAGSYTVLTSALEGEVDARSTAVEYLNTYVGINSHGTATGTGLLANVEILQKQADGVINTYSNTYDVMLGIEDPNNNTDNDQLVTTAAPYAGWLAKDILNGNEDERLAHIGDVYIKYSNTAAGAKEYIASYKFIKTTVDNTSPYATDADGFTWALIADQAAQDAYEQALNAYDLADEKRRVFVGLGATTTPKTPYDQGDLWLIDSERIVNGYQCKVGDILRCIETKGSIGTYEQNDWVLASSYANAVDAQNQLFQNFVNNDYATFVSNIQNQVDGKAETFYQNSVPTGRIKSLNVPDNDILNKYVGDLWKNTYVGTISGYLGDNTEYIYTKKANGANWDYDWTKMEVPDIVFDTIDTKKSIYRGNSVPVAVAPDVIEVNDIWITGSSVVGYDKESIYVWSGSAWVKPLKYTDDTATVALQNGLADGTVTVKLTNAFVGTTPFLTYLTSEIDSKVGVYSGETAPVAGQPSGVAANDIYLWFTTASKVLANGTTQVYDITRTYKYSGSAWNEITTDSNITALADLADGKRTVFSGNAIPVGAVNRDIWIPSATNGVYLQGEIYQYNGTAWVVATKYSADLEAVRSNLQSQVDGKVETYYQATVPVGMTAVNNGDYWYCTADVSTYKKGKVYKYVHATTSWVETADVSRYAFDTADGKAAVFLSNNLPTAGYKVNDMLIVIGSFNNGTTTFSDGVVLSSNSTRTSGFTPSDWVKKINDTEDLDAFVSSTYTPTVTSLQGQIDSKVESWFTLSTNDPKAAWTDSATRAKHEGDLWYQTDTKRSYYYTSGTNSWNLITDKDAIDALAAASAAQETADGVVVSFYAIKQDTAPATTSLWLNKTGTKVLKKYTTSWENVAVKLGDTLTAYDPVTKDTSVYVYNGTGWITNTENGIVASSEAITTLAADLATTNTTVGGHTTQLNTVDTRIANGVASVETKWAYNSVVNINGVYNRSGFGLSTNYTSGSGTQANPYTSEFWIDASRLKFTNSANSGAVSPFTIDASGQNPKISFNGSVSFENVTKSPMGSGSMVFKEDWYNSTTQSVSKLTGWSNYGGSGEIFITPEGLSIGNNSGNDMVTLVFDRSIPINTNKRYKLTALVKRTSGTGTAKFGIAGRDNTDTAWVNTTGSNSILTSQHYMINDLAPTTSMASYSSNYWSISNLVPGSDSSINSNAVYFRPMIIVNFNGLPGITVISGIKIEETEASVSSFIDSNNDVFAQSQGFANYADMVSEYSSVGKTIIDGGYINTGLVTTDSIEIGTGLINGFIQSNDFTTLGGSGFRLKSNASGTYEDPSIYGAYIRAGSLDITSLSLTQPGVSPVYPVSKLKFSDFFTADVKYSVRSDFTPTRKIIEFQSDVYPINYSFTSGPYRNYKYIRTDGGSIINYSYFIHSVFESAFEAEDGSISRTMFPLARFSVKPTLLEFFTDYAEWATSRPHASIDCTSVTYPNSATVTLASGHRVTFEKVETYWYLLLDVTHYVPNAIVKPINWICQVRNDMYGAYSGTIKTTGPINGSIHNF